MPQPAEFPELGFRFHFFRFRLFFRLFFGFFLFAVECIEVNFSFRCESRTQLLGNGCLHHFRFRFCGFRCSRSFVLLPVLHHLLGFGFEIFVCAEGFFEQVILLIVQLLVEVIVLNGMTFLFQKIGDGGKSYTKFLDCFV